MTIKRIAFFVTAAVALAACTSTVVRTSGATRTTAAAPRVSTPKFGVTVRVERGETLYGIAFRNGIDVRDLAAWNGIGAPYTIYPGQILRLYPRRGTTAATRPATTPPRPATTPPTQPATSQTAPDRPVATRPTTPPVTTPPPPAPAPASDIRWRWPAEGTLLNRFVAGEPTKQGIDITGDGGTPVNAAADGVVVYSGSGLVGYGELVIIKHSDAWLSAYGHNRARMVNEGAIVKAGQQIAVMGRTGAPRDMLHFEIRYNGKPVDPLLYLPKR
ncbi:peptidoglycan DD-metalloendopeptidase family protein [Lysobacter yangpyeongensis]|jgi:lipoprotein NlpD|uniref:Peptidoglycan DD-metalloendopeptidase family protein n=1 Tax=Lysobacter yangpyeongensis TaxID=346182 RepID=A0ABW0SNG9_9GAMM